MVRPITGRALAGRASPLLLVTQALVVLVVRRRQGYSMKDLHPPSVSP